MSEMTCSVPSVMLNPTIHFILTGHLTGHVSLYMLCSVTLMCVPCPIWLFTYLLFFGLWSNVIILSVCHSMSGISEQTPDRTSSKHGGHGQRVTL